MKIAILNWRDPGHVQAGGAECYLYEQARIWISLGHEVCWFSSHVPGRSDDETIEGIRYIRKGGRFGVYWGVPFSYVRHKTWRADIIVDAHNGVPFFSPLFASAKIFLLIFHVHKDVWRRELRPPLSWLGYFLEMHVMPWVYRGKPVVTISNSSQVDVERLMPGHEMQVIHSAVSDIYVPGPKAQTPEIAYVGRIKRYKSIDVLLRAVKRLDEPCTLHIIGRGDDEDRLKRLVRELNLKRVIFHGFMSDEDKVRLLQRVWIAINPSMVEGWGITNIEANACGTSVLGSDVPGIRDSIVDGETGFLFRYGDDQELAEKIDRLLRDPEMRAAMEKKALHWAARFSWEQSARKFLELMES